MTKLCVCDKVVCVCGKVLADACLLPLLPLGLLNYDMINGLSFLWVLFGYRPQSAHFDIRRLRSLLRL